MDDKRSELRRRLRTMRESRRAGAQRERLESFARLAGGSLPQAEVERALAKKNAGAGMQVLQKAMRKHRPQTAQQLPADTAPVPVAVTERPAQRPKLPDFDA